MIDADKLIEAARKRVVLWDFKDIYSTLIDAKAAALHLYARYETKGVTIRANKAGNFTVLAWQIEA